jgi:2-hydroxy-3-keto-5-methylthiopentenyl-1-phosphate phosphatase
VILTEPPESLHSFSTIWSVSANQATSSYSTISLATESALSQATEQDTLDYLNSITLDPAFPSFVFSALKWGYEYYIVSDGLDTFIHSVLENHGLGEIPVLTNHLETKAGVLHLSQPWRDENCRICEGAYGVCKQKICRWFQAQGCYVILIGDGMTDECGAASADQVFATGSLLDYCRSKNIPATPFDSFAAIQEAFEQMNSTL